MTKTVLKTLDGKIYDTYIAAISYWLRHNSGDWCADCQAWVETRPTPVGTPIVCPFCGRVLWKNEPDTDE